MVNLIIRLFAGRLSSFLASAILFIVLKIFAWLCVHIPEVAALCDPQAVADWLAAFLIALLNWGTNRYHLDRATTAKIAEAVQAHPPVIPIRPAIPVNEKESR